MFDTTYIIIDALDECEDSVQTRLINLLHSTSEKCSIRLLATSREISVIKDAFDADRVEKIVSIKHDIDKYVRAHLNELPRHIQRNEVLK